MELVGLERGHDFAAWERELDAPEPVVAPMSVEAPRPPRRHRRLGRLALLGALTALVVAAVPFLTHPPREHVTLVVDGQHLVLATRAASVADLLAAEGVVLAQGDRVVPRLDAAIDAGLAVRVLRAAAVVVDDDGVERTVPTVARNLDELAIELRVPAGARLLGPERLEPGARVTIRSPRPVVLVLDGVELRRSTTALTVRELLLEEDVAVPAGAVVTPGADEAITPGAVVTVQRPIGVGGAVPSSLARSPTAPVVSATGNRTTGTASWYESPFGSDSCATKEYVPKGTIILVTNLETGESTTCRVADRVVADRVVDLDDDVFARLSPLHLGVFDARITW